MRHADSGQALVLAAVSLMGIVLTAFLVFNVAHLAASINAITEGLWLAAESGTAMLDEAAGGRLASETAVRAMVATVAEANLAPHEAFFAGLTAPEVVQSRLQIAIAPAPGMQPDPFTGQAYAGPFVALSATIPLNVLWGALTIDRRFQVVAASGASPSGTPTPGAPALPAIAPTSELAMPTPTP